MKQLTTQDYIDAVARNGGSRVRAADELKIGIRNLYKRLAAAKAQGYDVPDAPAPNQATVQRLLEATEAAHHAAPEHYSVKGVSSYVDGEGVVRGQWIKTNQDDEQRLAMLKAAVEALAEQIPPQCPIPPPAPRLDRLANLYTITDYHVGMLAWRQEGGADWDLQIAERTLIGCFRSMIANSPPARLGIVNQLGDFLHFDGLEAVTPTSQHNLDTDSRFQKIVQVAVRSLRAIVNIALAKHERVHVIMAEGNHDIASSVWLRVLFGELYENEPRVTVEMSPLPYYAFQHGKVMLAFHHGHLTKKEKISGKIPAQFPKIWGETEFRYCHMGHMHSEWTREEDGLKVIQHPTLAARDAYAARGAWYSARGAKGITYHEEYGEIGSVTVTPEMIS